MLFFLSTWHLRSHFQLCDDTDLGPTVASILLKALIELSEASAYYPQSLLLDDVKIHKIPVAFGAFGDVYKGQLHAQTIAVKVLRMRPNEGALKV